MIRVGKLLLWIWDRDYFDFSQEAEQKVDSILTQKNFSKSQQY